MAVRIKILHIRPEVVRIPENGYWVSSVTSHALLGLEREGGSYVVVYSI